MVTAELKGKEQSRTRVTDAKVANKNEPTTPAGDTAGTQPTLNTYYKKKEIKS